MLLRNVASFANSALPTLRVAMVAGEASGDLLAGLLLDGLKSRWPQLLSQGIGGPQMVQRGFDAWWPSSRLAVRGYVEVLRHYLGIVRMRKQLFKRISKAPPDVFIGIDAPDFNLSLEQQVKHQGIKTVHFVCPSIWAWRPQRIEQIKSSVDHMLCIFPFEVDLLAQHGIAATYVGHPLAQVIPLAPSPIAARQKLNLSPSAPLVALLPGSRASEIHYLASKFMEAAALIHQRNPSVQFVLPCAPGLRPMVENIGMTFQKSYPQLANLIRFIDGQSHLALEACDVTLIASGTATLEAALYKKPMVIAYNMNPLSWWIMQPKRLQPWVGLPNILGQDFWVPELLQEQATPANMAFEVLQWFDEPERAERLKTRFFDMHHELRRDTSALCAHAIEKVLAG